MVSTSSICAHPISALHTFAFSQTCSHLVSLSLLKCLLHVSLDYTPDVLRLFSEEGKREEKQIANINGKSHYSEEETSLRNQLASLYRLVDKFHWSQSIYNHMTVG